jgi:hypothetical protein
MSTTEKETGNGDGLEAGTQPTSPASVSIQPKETMGSKVRSRSGTDSESGTFDEPHPHLHAKTFLAVFAVCCIYFVEIYNVVGAGAVSKLLQQQTQAYHIRSS